jgi:3-oxoacyl-(acyl-carrier-protein) synthase
MHPGDIALIHAHGTSTPLNDKTETRAIQNVFGESPDIPVTATKSMTGHSLGASGAFGALVCLLALQTGIAPQTINLENPDTECDLNHIRGRPRILDLSGRGVCALSNAFAFGGANAALLFGRGEH